ncbi:TAT-variant-translocated molybdopterin oxidoreductase [Tautonia plasticadhaerens]|uniref:Tetrathionate reductase subunit B n=1 Tax=Tautonia plasticadhaerens TaxID=2527974 RepID=A0A518H8F6_9BACT|nr:TAT-variant-translocated molybdopterin oxidoreductase [Tautonia plasticadhaerens]QDV37105.1 Tetrathionate reductase subunit B precursor [Tautonia plasticadhaerens]
MREPQHAPKRTPLNLSALRSRLDGASGPQYWRGLEQLSESEEFLRYVQREFPEQADTWDDPTSRRQFLKLMAASLALAGVSGCAFSPPERIVPYVKAPEEMVQGRPLFFATSMKGLDGDAVGLLVESQEGRPIKIEGNALHPASPACLPPREPDPGADPDRAEISTAVGATDIFAQAELLSLYDPDRSQSILRNGRPSTWEDFQEAMADQYEARRAKGSGEGLRILTGTITSPTLADQIARLTEALPGARWHQYEPVNRDNARRGAIRAFGEDVQPVFDLEQADRILSLDADFLYFGPGHLVLARGYADRRDPDHPRGINRLYSVECNLTVTGSKADHRLPLAASRIKDFALALARQVGVDGLPEPSAELPEEATAWVGPLARDLAEHQGTSLVLAGEGQPPSVHALAHAMNLALGNVGKTVKFINPVEARSVDQAEDLRDLVDDLKAGEVDILVMIGVNPVYDAPVDLGFGEAMVNEKVLRIHSGLYLDETGELCQWHVPEAHFLEAWGDGRAFDGTATLAQPLIAPLYGGKSAIEVLAALLVERNPEGRVLLEQYWGGRLAEGVESPTEDPGFQKRWRKILHDGLVPETGSEAVEVSIQEPGSLVTADDTLAAEGGELELVLAPDPTIYDGRYANNAWLQECPKPVTKLTWDNALMVPASLVAEDSGGPLSGLEMGDVVGLTVGTVTVNVPIFVMPGHAEGAVTLHLGYGRRRAGRVGDGTGFNAYEIRPSGTPWIIPGVSLNATGQTYELASTQLQRSIEGRDLIREATLEQYQANPDFAHAGHHVSARHGEETPSLYPSFDYSADRGEGWNGYPGYAWGMTVDLNRCVGCAACVVACQAENNIPVVGKREVKRGRIMHWMEVDRYFAVEGRDAPTHDLGNPKVAFQPRFCMHCEKAPCEPVCPVGATVHDHEGLNNMVYNRCVGTRYCSNNCPYKVRHFNFLKYSKMELEDTSLSSGITPLVLLHNPDVTVRSRGVMEKCTYCVQRIYEGKIQSELEGRRVRDGEIVTACQAACPTRALVFGDLNDETSEVTRLKKSPRNYGMLAEELNTRPRTTYLARVTNPNPEIATA